MQKFAGMIAQKQTKHLFSRAGFGIQFGDIGTFGALQAKEAVKMLLQQAPDSAPLNVVENTVKFDPTMRKDAAARKMFLMVQREQRRALNLGWMDKLIHTDAVLQEKMTLFWHNHFACRSNIALFDQQLNNLMRKNALGNFRTLLFGVAKSPAMLQFLNNQQNRKSHPNENFAREVMELFTIGRGRYTEKDVKESARAFTGFGFNRSGEFAFRKFLHDDGQKTFLGKTGNFTGDDIMDILLERKETAYFVSNKLYKYLVNETPDPEHVQAMADVFYQSGYEIKPLLEFVFTSEWFYDEKNTGCLIKSPVDFLTVLSRRFYISYDKPQVLLQFQRALGQVLFYPPNVAGWPGGRNWIDSSSLMYRLKIPSLLLNGGIINFKGKTDPEDEALLAGQQRRERFVNIAVDAKPDWKKFLGEIPAGTDAGKLAALLLECKPGPALMANIHRQPDLKALAIDMVSTPEYQLC